MRNSSVPANLLAVRPSHWPDVTVSTNRMIKNRRFIAMSKIRWLSPITSEVAEFSFAGFGTTLRGARQQRHVASGWARWDNAGLGPANDPTLDSY